MTYKYILSSFIKSSKKNGLKEPMENIIKKVLSIVKKSTSKEPLFVLYGCINNCKPFCEVKSIRISGTNYKVPVKINSDRQKFLVISWLLDNSLKKPKIGFVNNLASEIIDTYNYESRTIKICEELHKIAESNKIYIKFKN